MTFENWMLNRGLSQSTAVKYAGAVRGVLSEWAQDAELVLGSLESVKSANRFLAVVSKLRHLPIFLERNERGHNMYSNSLARYAEYLAEQKCNNEIETDVEAILTDTNASATEKIALVKARIGQGIFRERLLTYWAACAVTSYTETNLLVASHIKPWHAASNTERLDPFNGLMLVPNLDRAFDVGYITFEQGGAIRISPLLSNPQALGISSSMRVNLAAQHLPFLAFHRSNVYHPGYDQS